MCCEILQPVIKATGREQLENFVLEKVKEFKKIIKFFL